MKNNVSMLKSIESRIIFFLIVIGFIPLVISLILNNLTVSDSILKLEEQNAHALGSETSTIIDEKLNQFGMIAKDYSIWDDAYEKLDEKDQQWFKENFSEWIPGNFNVDLSVVINKNGEVIDEFGLKNNDVSQLLGIESISNILKVPYDANKPVYAKGILMYSGDPYLFYASPILKSYYKGDTRGIFIIGKKISSSFMGEIEKRLGEKAFMSFGDKNVYSEETGKSIEGYIRTKNMQRGLNNVSFVNNEIMTSMSLGKVENADKATITVIMNRDIFLNTKKDINTNIAVIMWFAFISIIIMVLLLRRTTIRPLNKFKNEIISMNENNVVSYVEVDGPEELERIKEAFNSMVNKLNEQSVENQQLRSELEYDSLRSEFITNVSHEFRTPLNVILGTIQLIELFLKKGQNENMPPNLGKHVQVMKQNCYRLLRLINNLIDLTKIRSNAFKINMNNYNIVSLVEDITLSVADYIKSNDITVGFDTDTEEKIMACDPDQIERIILNLLSNAIKFTNPGGEIWVTIQDKGDTFVISVKDNGTGIPEDQLDAIFQRFNQVDRSLTRNHEGSGIGLSLVKSLVEMHNGTVRVLSEPGKGSEFIIELPVEIIPEITEGENKNSYVVQNKVERINIEFSDIYQT